MHLMKTNFPKVFDLPWPEEDPVHFPFGSYYFPFGADALAVV